MTRYVTRPGRPGDAGDAAGDAARQRQRARLHEMLIQAADGQREWTWKVPSEQVP